MRERQRTGTGGGSLETQAPFSSATFKLPLTNTLAPVGGYGPATFTRSTTATVFDNEGILKEVRAGAARFTGARRVANSCPSSENFNGFSLNQSTAVAYSGALPPNVASAISLVANSTNNAHYASISLFWTGKNQVFSCYVKAGTISKVLIANASFARGVFFNLNTGTVEGTIGSLTSTITAVNDGWFKLTVAHTSGGANTFSISGYITYTGTFVSTWTYQLDGGSIHVTGMQMEDVTGQSDQTPSEYVSVGTTPPNLLTYTEDLTNSVYSNTNTTITRNSIANPIDGVVNATKVEATSAAATSLSYQANGIGSASGMTCSIYIKKGSGATDANRFYLRNDTTATNIVSATVDFDAGTTNAGTLTSVGSGWYKLVLSSASGFSNGDNISIYLGFIGNSETANEFCYVYGPTLVQGVSDPTYTPVGAAYDPHGSGADGVKYFKTNKDLTSISPSLLKGYLTEGAATNNLLWNRDLTNAAWTKSNMTTALTATGIDGQANAASVLTATAGDATCLQPRTLASAARSFSAYVKRRTGTGTISITRDGGTTWTDITNSIITGTYLRVYIENTSVTNPSCGFKITTSGDAIDVDYCQDEDNNLASNPIATTTTPVTRNQDVLYYPMAGNITGTSSTALADFSFNERNLNLLLQGYALSFGSNGRIIYNNPTIPGTTTYLYDGTNAVSGIGFLRTFGNLVKTCVSWGTNKRIISAGNFTVSSLSFDGTMDNTGTLYVGSESGSSVGRLFGNVRGIYTWSSELTDTQMKQAANA